MIASQSRYSTLTWPKANDFMEARGKDTKMLLNVAWPTVTSTQTLEKQLVETVLSGEMQSLLDAVAFRIQHLRDTEREREGGER